MSKIDEGGYVYPHISKVSENAVRQAEAVGVTLEGEVEYTGITRRDYLAAMAMQGIITHGHQFTGPTMLSDIASNCYEIADAMIKKSKEVDK